MSPAPADSAVIPRHVAIIMDGNGRWARARHLPRTEGHRQGVHATRMAVRFCAARGVEALTLFAFSSENWKRPSGEVNTLMNLFVSALEKELPELVQNNIRLRFIGEREAFSTKLKHRIHEAEAATRDNTGMELVIAVSYGGRWDITTAVRRLVGEVAEGRLDPASISVETLDRQLSTAGLPDPDLFIRTGGEHRLSNFLLWQMAYTELYFCDVLWPDFDEDALQAAFECFAGRERRFGRTGEQVSHERA
ncbi:isoprenyl transferase [Thioalkalivibrio sulfidiphilus]|uniref:isoprenyl transferase n=1 Tax=Thioalkalivibrio sulfidiphilus TaxID=1033854 RepID=UPI003B2BFB90